MALNRAVLLDYVRRYPIGVACGVVGVLLGVAAWELHGRLELLDRQYHELSESNSAILDAITGARNLRAEAEDVHAAVAEIDHGLFDPGDIAENHAYFYDWEDRLRVRLFDLRQLPTQGAGDESYRVVPFSLRMTGSYVQVAAYLHQLETGPRVMRITDFRIDNGDPEARALQCTLTVEVLAKP
jgi:hypothetical protein